MSARELLIDGYNLLHAAGMGRADYRPGELLQLRQRLLDLLLERLTAAELARGIVVFDARDPPPDRPAQSVVRQLQVWFATPRFAFPGTRRQEAAPIRLNGEADQLIMAWLDRHTAPKRVRVISSDHQIQAFARRCGATCQDSELFLRELATRNSSQKKRAAEADRLRVQPLTATDLNGWLQVFADADPARLAQELAAEQPPRDAPAAAVLPPVLEPVLEPPVVEAAPARGKQPQEKSSRPVGRPLRKRSAAVSEPRPKRDATRADSAPAASAADLPAARKPRRVSSRTSKSDPERKLTDAELSYWLNLFGPIPGAVRE